MESYIVRIYSPDEANGKVMGFVEGTRNDFKKSFHTDQEMLGLLKRSNVRERRRLERLNDFIPAKVTGTNIEEKSFYDATVAAGENLIHYHLCENDRGIPGTGLVDWDGIFRALAEIGYDGFAALESFVDCTDNMNTWVWRQLAPDGDTLLKEGVAFIRDMQAKHGLA